MATIHAAVTGGIASGKTMVCKIIACFGIDIYYSDARAARMMECDDRIITALKQYFGEDIYCDSKLNKTVLAHRIFENDIDRAFVDSVVHPVVLSDYFEWRKHTHNSITIIETALLPRLSALSDLHEVIYVRSPLDLRMKRLIERNSISPEMASRRVAAQVAEAEYINTATHIIENNEKRLLFTQVVSVLEQIETKHG